MQIKKYIKIIHKLSDRISYTPGYSILGFTAIFIVLFFVYTYDEILFLRPQGIHQWRQCDCLSFALNYYQDGNPFLEPSMHNLAGDGTGKTASDFPILYFFVAQLWKIFGFHEFIFRLVTLIITFAGLSLLFKTLEQILEDSLWAIGITLLLFTSPVLVYYSNNFLTNVPAFSISLVGWYFFWKFYKSEKNMFFYYSMFFFLLGGLLKITSTISFITILGIFLIEQLNIFQFREGKKIFRNPKKQVISFLMVILIISVWYLYAHNYNETNNKGFFLIGILPIWDLSNDQIHNAILAIKEHLKWDYFSRGTSILLGILWLVIFLFYKKVNKFLLILTGFLSAGFILFVLLFFQALEHHDYYTINLMILSPVILLTSLLVLKKLQYKIFRSILLKVIFLIFIIHNIGFARNMLEDRYSEYGWMNENRTKHTYSFENVTPYLRSLGITGEDKVICIPDQSINITLYLMNQKGWTGYNIQNDSLKVAQKIEQGAKYLFIYEKEGYDPKIMEPFISEKVGEYENIKIYSLQKEFLGHAYNYETKSVEPYELTIMFPYFSYKIEF